MGKDGMTLGEFLLTHGEAYSLLFTGVVVSILVIIKRPWCPRPHGSWSTTVKEAATSSVISLPAFFAFRAVLAIYCWGIFLERVINRGPIIFKFYTIWNWVSMTVYFTLAAIQSAQLLRASGWGQKPGPKADRTQPDDSGPQGPEGGHSWMRETDDCGVSLAVRPEDRVEGLYGVGRIGHAVVVLFHLNMTMVIVVDTVTWIVLEPMMRHSADPAERLKAQKVFYNFSSYNMHGFNGVMMLAELVLCNIPFYGHIIGYVSAWSMGYLTFGLFWHATTDTWIYPFMDTSKWFAGIAYFGLFVAHWVYFFLFRLTYMGKQAIFSAVNLGRKSVASKTE